MPDFDAGQIPAVMPVGKNPTLLWGLTAKERLQRIAGAQGLALGELGNEGPVILADTNYVFDPAWLRFVAARPGIAVTQGGKPFLAHCRSAAEARMMQAIMTDGAVLPSGSGFQIVAQDDGAVITNDELRKRETPFAGQLTPATTRALERASYFGAYKGVTDILTKYLWPEWALVLTRIAARAGISPNMVTALGAFFCVVATICFYYGWYWTGMATGLAFMVLDTVDGKLARCTITSSKLGNVFDHGIDLVHPPFWWWAWGVGLSAYGLPLSDTVFAAIMIIIIVCYVLQRLVEGVFIQKFGMHIHVWRKFNSWFRLITARRNPNMVLLFASLLIGRPDLGLISLAVWTVLSLFIHVGQLCQAIMASAQGSIIKSWLA